MHTIFLLNTSIENKCIPLFVTIDKVQLIVFELLEMNALHQLRNLKVDNGVMSI